MDSIILTSPGGSAIQVGSWLDISNAGADYGARDLIRPSFVDNPFTDGELGFEDVSIRHMAFPLLINPRAVASLTQLEALLTMYARPGAYVDVQVEGVPTAEAVRFDVVTGRWEPAYDTFLQRVDRRRGTLFLDTKPYGYWPTQILLASTASVGLPGDLRFTGSIIGDAAGLAEIKILPRVPSSPIGTWKPDFAAFGFHGRPSFSTLIPVGSVGFGGNGPLSIVTGAGTTADAQAPGSWAQFITAGATSAWRVAFSANLIAPIGSHYIGAHRAFGLFKFTPSQIGNMLVTLDAIDNGINGNLIPLASAAPIATLPPNLASGLSAAGAAVTAYGVAPTAGYQILDLGELRLPVTPSAVIDGAQIRVWAKSADGSTNDAAVLSCGGLYLLPLSGVAGIMPRGLAFPTVLPQSAVDSLWLRPDGGAWIAQAGASIPDGNARRYFQGVTPVRLGPSVNAMSILVGNRWVGSGASYSTPLVRLAAESAAVSVTYTPRFQFLKGL